MRYEFGGLIFERGLYMEGLFFGILWYIIMCIIIIIIIIIIVIITPIPSFALRPVSNVVLLPCRTQLIELNLTLAQQ